MPSQPKGQKGRKAAKKRKARQTRKHREARQARRDRKGRRDHEVTSVGAADTSFHRFPDLPLEIREMIWENCIPSRLVFHGLKFHDHLDKELRQSQRRPPIISHVCHEARRTAFRHGSRITIGTWYRGLSRALSHPVSSRPEEAWFDTRRDTLLLCQTRLKGPFDLYPPFMGPLYWLEISNDGVAATKTSGRLACIGPYTRSIENQFVSDIFGSEWLHGADVGYVVKRYYLLAPLSATMASGLFGLFGESRAIAVDLDDTDTFRALKKLQSPCYDRRKLHDLAWNFQGEQLEVDDFDDLDEIAIEEISEHGKAWWLSGRLNLESEQLHEENPESRLLALFFLVLDE